jgi:hypothetical protein
MRYPGLKVPAATIALYSNLQPLGAKQVVLAAPLQPARSF